MHSGFSFLRFFMLFEEFALTNVDRKVSIRFSQYPLGSVLHLILSWKLRFALVTNLIGSPIVLSLVLFCVCLLFSVNPLIGVYVRGGRYCLFQQSRIE